MDSLDVRLLQVRRRALSHVAERRLLAAIPPAAIRDADRGSSWGALKLKLQQMKALLEGKEVFERHLRFLLDDDFDQHVPSPIRPRSATPSESGYELLPELDDLSRLAMMTFQGNVPNLENRKLQASPRAPASTSV